MGNFIRALSKSGVLVVALLFTLVISDHSEARECRGFFADVSEAGLRGLPSQQSQQQAQSPKLRENSQLKIVTWNMLNLTVPKVDSKTGLKDDWAISELAKAANEINADIYVIQEVSRIEALKYLVKRYLNDEYEVVSERGNVAGSQIGFLIKKSLDIDFELRTHKDVTYRERHGIYRVGEPVFVRDLPELYLRQKDGSNISPSQAPDIVVLGAHFKSKMKTRGDHESSIKREYEAQMSAVIIQSIDKRFNREVPIVLAGDFNTEVMTSKETESLRFVLKDSLTLMGNKLSPDQRVTHTWHSHKGGVSAQQIDGLLINNAMARKLVNARVYHYRNSLGQEKIFVNDSQTKFYPLTYQQRSTNPSDHMPIIGTYDMTR